ncbi:DUF393 domain-containing protein [Rhodovulum iodosum]|nr:DCC1-like thiol-disulfide oxidoreductase family protein [Rhodovulum robiginosum]RSK38349.1 DUF393 domain-containing protein [Rhodovulum robiginosum]
MPDPAKAVPAGEDNWLLYDGDCPFCSRYVALVRIRDAVGPLRLINAREGGPEFDEVMAKGLDLDGGMVLKLSGQFYHGQDSIHALALLSAATGPISRFNGWVFRSRTRAAVLYPVLRAGRNMTLRLLGRKRIRPE